MDEVTITQAEWDAFFAALAKIADKIAADKDAAMQEVVDKANERGDTASGSLDEFVSLEWPMADWK